MKIGGYPVVRANVLAMITMAARLQAQLSASPRERLG